MSAKDHEHIRRLNSQQESADVFVFEEVTVHYSREEFLSNTKNKEQLIKLLASHFVTQGHQVLNCEEGADTQIVTEALDVACRKENVTVVAEDTDILVLLLYVWNTGIEEIFHDIRTKKEAGNLNYNFIKNLLFIHAWSGCDTTSATFNQGKTTLMKFIANNKTAILDVCPYFIHLMQAGKKLEMLVSNYLFILTLCTIFYFFTYF